MKTINGQILPWRLLMRKKTLLQTILPLCIVALTALCISFSTVFTKAFASEPEWTINTTAYNNVLPRNSVLQIPEGNKATLNGTDYSLSTTVTFPSEKTSTGDKVVLSEVGGYTIKYSFTDGVNSYEETHDFSVQNTTDSFFAKSEGVEITTNAEIPDYIKNGELAPSDVFTETREAYNGSTKGVKVKVHGETAVLRYEGVIDASKLNLNDDLIELHVTPEVYDEVKKEGVLEFSDGAGIQIRFYDAVYNDINLTFLANSYSRIASGVSVKANESISDKGFGYVNYNEQTARGSSYANSSFYGTYNPDEREGGYWPLVVSPNGAVTPTSSAYRPTTSSLRLRYDSERNAAYSYPSELIYISKDGGYDENMYKDTPLRDNGIIWNKYVDKGIFEGDGLWDFDDYVDHKRGDEFYGFPSGMVKMEITFPNLGKNTANFMIFKIGGQSLADWEEESYETKIYVDTEGADENNLPEVIAGKNSFYPIFNAYGYNYVEGVLADPSVKVYFDKKAEENLLPIVNNTFPVTKTGKYYIEYTVNPDPTVGEPVKKRLEIVAREFYDYDVSFRVNNLISNSAFVGDRINLHEGILDFTLDGANVSAEKSPFFNVATEVFYNNKLVKVTDDVIDYFIAEKAGTYTVNYSSIDYAGEKTYLAKREVVVSENNGITFGNIVLPKALVNGAKYEFPVPTATLNTANGVTPANVKVSVGGVDYTYKKFDVPASGEVTVKYTATCGSVTASKEYTLNIINNGKDYEMNVGSVDYPEYDVPFLTNYLILPNSYSYQGYSATNVPMKTTSVASNEKVEFINAIDVKYFRIMFMGDVENDPEAMFEVVVTDAVNPNQKVVLGFKQVSASRIEIYNVLDNGELVYLTFVNANFNESTFNLIMKDSSGDIYQGASKIATVKKYASGFNFFGFDSGYVYLSFGYASGSNNFVFSNIAGQAFNLGVARDLVKPSFYFDNELSSYSEKDVDDSIIIELPYVYDVLSPIKENVATIKYPDGSTKIIDKTNDGYELKFGEKGYGDYTITFTVTDYADRRAEAEKRIVVKDFKPPIITINGEIPSLVKVGTIFSLPSATAIDMAGSEAEVSICYVFKGRVRNLFADNDQFTNPIYFEEAGIYRIHYTAVGVGGNRSIKTIVVEAK
jgi:hypothetical protein